ncbi:hypothetical protein ACJRO7_035336 [Eucalyptus globulus]|uniref:Kinesin light chain n=1 Tax=Eucalyptus globulus TaxID=34317 RepID=A0ABD3JBF6_EUCGL
MPGLVMYESRRDYRIDDSGGNQSFYKEDSTQQFSPRSPLSPHTPSPHSDSDDLALDGVVDTSIEQLYYNVCEMQSSDQSPSGPSFLSYGEESRIDSELCHLVGDFGALEIMKEVVIEKKEEGGRNNFSGGNSTPFNGSEFAINLKATPKQKPVRGATKRNASEGKPPIGKISQKSTRKPNPTSSVKKQKNLAVIAARSQQGVGDSTDTGLDNPDLGPFLLKQAKDMMCAGENPQRALEVALRAMKSYEKCSNGKPNLDFVMCLHVLAGIYCNLCQFSEAIPILERSIEIPVLEEGETHALAKFAGCMQLGDTYAMLGQIENSILCYTAGLEIQKQVLGETDPRVGETCRYLAEAHVQALQFDEAEKLCQMAIDLHREKGSPAASLEEAADRKLMGLICDSKGDYESALEHYVLASMAMASKGQEIDVALIDCGIGDAYLSLARYDEAIFAYQKALTVFKSTKGENHPSVASVFVRLADLYNKIGKFRDSKSYCENALKIFSKPTPGIPLDEIANGLIDVSAIYQSMNELEQALKLLKKALRIYGNAPGKQSTVAGIEAQMGVMYYMMGKYSDSYNSLKTAVSKFRASGEKKSPLFGISVNQLGLACVQCFAINEAAELFEEARDIMEKEYGPYHPDTLGVYSNLAGTYDAMGRSDDAIQILEYVVGMREEKLGTANPDVEDERQRLFELLKEAGKVRNRKSRRLETLLDTDTDTDAIQDDGIRVL